jgi:hypothetical protein
MRRGKFTRRDFLKTTGMVSAMAAAGTLPLELLAAEKRMVKFPEKTDLLLLTSRPPQLETSLPRMTLFSSAGTSQTSPPRLTWGNGASM